MRGTVRPAMEIIPAAAAAVAIAPSDPVEVSRDSNLVLEPRTHLASRQAPLVERRPHPTDRRSTLVTITDGGSKAQQTDCEPISRPRSS